MPRPKKKSVALPDAAKRLSGMRSIDPNLDFGNGYSNFAFEALIKQVEMTLDVYNTLLSKLDEAYSAFEAAERELAKFSGKMLANVAIRYDKDSNEYVMAGGVRPSKRKRSTSKKAESNVDAA
jgi:hypothetical protein